MATELIAIFTSSDSAELVEAKRCTKCHEIKALSEYYTDNRNDDGKYSHCKECAKDYTRSYIAQDEERWDEYRATYYLEHKEHMNQQSRDWAIEHPREFWARCTISFHKSYGFNVNIDQDKLIELAHKTTHCPICNKELNWSQGDKGCLQKNSPALDRMNNEREMTNDNTWIICVSCNSSKGRKTLKEWIHWCKEKGRVNNLCT